MTRTVYLDLDGTLVEFDRPYADLVTDALGAAGVEDPDPVADAFGELFFEYFESFADHPYRRALADAFDARGVDADPGLAADRLVEAELDATVLRDGARAAVDRLARGNVLGVLTNGVPSVQRTKLDRVGLGDAFDAVVVSYEVGAHKPDPAIFEAARDRLPADEYVYLGDDHEHDVAPAREAGFRAIHLDDSRSGVSAAGFEELLAVSRLFGD